MAVILLLVFIVAASLIVWAAFLCATKGVAVWLRVAYLGSLMLAVLGAYWTTFRYVYFSNPNTRYHGAPVPYIVFQRDRLDGPWWDFVGPLVVLAYPLNIILFALVPSLLFLVVYGVQKRRLRKHARATPMASSPLELHSSQGPDSGNPYEPPAA